MKSLVKFVHGLGAIELDVRSAMRLPKATLTEIGRILTEVGVRRMIDVEMVPHKEALTRPHTTAVGKGGDTRVLGKGNKLRTVGSAQPTSACPW